MWWRKRQPLTCSDHGGYVTFSRALTADEMTVLRFAWDAAVSGCVRPNTGWPPMPKAFPPPPEPPPPPHRSRLPHTGDKSDVEYRPG